MAPPIMPVTRFTASRRSDYNDALAEAEKRLNGRAFKEGGWDRVEVAWRPQVRNTYRGEFLIDFVKDGVDGAPGKPVYDAA